MDIVTLFCEIDDFCQRVEPWLNRQLLPARQRERESRMHLSDDDSGLVSYRQLP